MIKFRNKGFTILELLATILVITIGILTTYSVTQRIFAQTVDSASRIQAVYLAKEGIEIVRNIRDTNWIEDAPSWRDGLTEGDWQADYTTDQIINDNYDDGDFLNIDGNGFYGYSAGTSTKFKRRIVITTLAPDEMKVEVEVSWQKRGKDYSLIVQENLYDWK